MRGFLLSAIETIDSGRPVAEFISHQRQQPPDGTNARRLQLELRFQF